MPNREFADALGRALHRPARLRVPFAVLRPAFGGIAAEVFGGLRVVPARLTAEGFVCRHPDVDTAIRAALTGDRRPRPATRPAARPSRGDSDSAE